MKDEDQTIPRICDYSRLSKSARSPQPTLAQELQHYAALKEELRSSIAPGLLAANDAAFNSALNGLMTEWGYTRHPAIVGDGGEPDPELHTSARFGGQRLSIFGWVRMFFLGR